VDFFRPNLEILISQAPAEAVQSLATFSSPQERALEQPSVLAETTAQTMVASRPELEDSDDRPPEQPADAVGVPRSLAERLVAPSDAPTGGGLEGRRGEAKGQLLDDGGGTPQSELAVLRGLRWLAAHQRNDGSWHFDHRQGNLCNGACRDPGSSAATTGATGVALLAFLGAGHTHREGEHQEIVRRGLYYLSGRMLDTEHGGDLQEGTMYAHGLASIALCEAYAMTRDPDLKPLAQRAIDFIVYAQDAKGGGWRYFPGQPGDTTVTGWQWMALKSAQMAYLVFPAMASRASTARYTAIRGRATATPRRPSACCAGCMGAGREATRPCSRAYTSFISGARRPMTCTTITTPPRCCTITAAACGSAGTRTCASS
jgi:hypothetical protein